jgi:hypothetical protein
MQYQLCIHRIRENIAERSKWYAFVCASLTQICGKSSTKETKGLIGSGGSRYDLMGWIAGTLLFRH